MRPLGRYNQCSETAYREIAMIPWTNLSFLKNNLKPKPTPESSESQRHREVQNRRQILFLYNVPSNICPQPKATSLRRVSCGKISQQAERTDRLVRKACFSLSALGLGAGPFHHPYEGRDTNLAVSGAL